HCHADTEAGGRLIADTGRRDFLHTGFLNYQAARDKVAGLAARYDRNIGGRFALVELLRHGSTTVVEMGAADDTLVETAGPSAPPAPRLTGGRVTGELRTVAVLGTGTSPAASAPPPAPAGSSRSTTAPTAIACAACSSRSRWTPARQPCSPPPGPPPTTSA